MTSAAHDLLLLPFMRAIGLVILATFAPAIMLGQATGTPSYSAPACAFQSMELGAMVSFPEPGGTAYEGVYRAANGRIDVGVRGGVFQPGGFRPSSILAGFEIRSQIIRHDPAFPLDGALIVGAGGSFVHMASNYTIPVGLSLGRRISFDGSALTVFPYLQPTVLLRGGQTIDTGMIVGLGFGTDVRVSNALGVRLGAGIGKLQGVSLGFALVH